MRIPFLISAMLCLMLLSCSAPIEQPLGGLPTFKSDRYGFSFQYPSGWTPVTKDLPDRWAIIDPNQDTILFTVNPAPVRDVALLGNFQAMRDLYNTQNQSGLSPDKVEAISKIVKTAQFGGKEWYTYAIDFRDKDVQSIVSGTLCGDSEITLVLISNVNTVSQKTGDYTALLESFACSAS